MNKERQLGEVNQIQLSFKSITSGNCDCYVERSIINKDSLDLLQTCVGHEIEIIAAEDHWSGCDDEEDHSYATMRFQGIVKQVDENGIEFFAKSGEKKYGERESYRITPELINLPYGIHKFSLRDYSKLDTIESIKDGGTVFKLL